MGAPDQPSLDAGGFAALKRLRRMPQAAEICEICSRDLGAEHPHAIDPRERRIVCTCDACALLFESSTSMRYRRIPRDAFHLRNFEIDDVEWESLSIPIGLAFFFESSAMKRVTAVYPSPGGAVQAEVPQAVWQEITQRHPRVQQMQADVQALLVNRLGDSSRYFLAPIDRCYELTGLLRKYWSGFTGGDELWAEVHKFFKRLAEQAIGVGAMDARPAV